MIFLEVETPPQFSFNSTLRSHGWVQLPPFEAAQDFSYVSRIHQLSDDGIIKLIVTPGEDGRLEIVVENGDGELSIRQLQEVMTAVRRMFNLDVALQEFYSLMRDNPRYEWVERYGAGRLFRAPTVWEDLVKTLMTTNTTWGATRGMVTRITELGDQLPEGEHTFPGPDRIASLEIHELDQHVRAGYRTEYLYELAQQVAAGDLSVESWQDPGLSSQDLYNRVTSLKGFGPYAAGSVLKLLGKFDRIALDTVARKMYVREHNTGEAVSDSEIRSHYEPYGKWRGLVLWLDLLRPHLLRSENT